MNESPPHSINLLCGGEALEENYPVYYDDRAVGKVTVSQHGLFYFVSCRCSLPEVAYYRLFAQCKTHVEEMGVLVPDGNVYGLQIHIPCKRLSFEQPVFYIGLRNSQRENIAVLNPLNAVSCIAYLDTAYLQRDGNVYRLIFKTGYPGSAAD